MIQFCRTAERDSSCAASNIRAGESLCLFYAVGQPRRGGLRRPFAFRVDRSPTRTSRFGIGEHFCLGANLARLELRVIFRAAAARLEPCELIGPV